MSNYASDDAFTFKRQYKDVDVPGVGTIRIQTLSGAETGPIQAASVKFATASNGKDLDKASRAAQQATVETICAGVVDANGNRRWTTPEQKKFVASWGAPLQEFVASEINRFNDLDTLNLEDVAKNSETTQFDSAK
jgi:hypothetical protein